MTRRAILAVAVLGACGCASNPPSPPPPSPPLEPSPAVVSPRPASVVLSTDSWEFAGHRGRLIRTTWYRLFTTESDPALLGAMPEFLEEALEHYTSAIVPLPRPPMPLDTFLMATRPQWSLLTEKVMGPADAKTYLRIQRGGFAAGGRALLWTIGARDTLAIAAHEGWHQYTQRTFKEWLPVWLEEGLATFMEGFVPDPAEPRRPIFLGWANPERFEQLRTAASRGELMPLGELLRLNPQELISASTDRTLTYYAQVWALVHFLREGDRGTRRKALAALAADAAEGRLERMLALEHGPRAARAIVLSRRGPAVFTAYFGKDIDAIDREYREFIALVVEAGSRERIMSGRSPLEP